MRVSSGTPLEKGWALSSMRALSKSSPTATAISRHSARWVSIAKGPSGFCGAAEAA